MSGYILLVAPFFFSYTPFDLPCPPIPLTDPITFSLILIHLLTLLHQRGLLLLNELALLVVALGREQRPALAPRQRDLPRIAN